MRIKVMTRFAPLFIGFFSFTLSFGQGKVDNIKTDQHRQIPGTKFFLVPPAGFSSATNFQGLQQTNSGASILVMEIPGPFSEATKGFDEQGLKTQGVILKKKEDIMVNGDRGLLLATEQFAHGTTFTKYILVFGDTKVTCMINATFPKQFAELDESIRKSMLSVVYESALVVDPLSTVPFQIYTDDTKLKFARSITGRLLYTVDGKVPTESSDKTSFLIGLSLGNVQTADKKQTALNRAKKLPYSDIKIDEDSVNEFGIDGITGYEIVGEGFNNSSTPELVYQVMLFTDSGYYLMVGSAKDDFAKNLELFRKLASTFKRK